MKNILKMLGLFLFSTAVFASDPATSSKSPTITPTNAEAYNVSMTSAAQLRPDLAGIRMVGPTAGPVYLVNPEGALQWIPDGQTYNNLFRNWDNIQVLDLSPYVIGAPLSNGALLINPNGGGHVYLLSNGVKRWVTSGEVMSKYNFNYDAVVSMPQIIIDSLPSGANYQ